MSLSRRGIAGETCWMRGCVPLGRFRHPIPFPTRLVKIKLGQLPVAVRCSSADGSLDACRFRCVRVSPKLFDRRALVECPAKSVPGWLSQTSSEEVLNDESGSMQTGRITQRTYYRRGREYGVSNSPIMPVMAVTDRTMAALNRLTPVKERLPPLMVGLRVLKCIIYIELACMVGCHL